MYVYAGTQIQHGGMVVVGREKKNKKTKQNVHFNPSCRMTNLLIGWENLDAARRAFCVPQLWLNENQDEKGANQSVANGLRRQTIQKGPPRREGRVAFDIFRDAEVRGSVISWHSRPPLLHRAAQITAARVKNCTPGCTASGGAAWIAVECLIPFYWRKYFEMSLLPNLSLNLF